MTATQRARGNGVVLPMDAAKRLEFTEMLARKSAEARRLLPDTEDDTIDAETLLGMEFPPLSFVIPGYVVEGLTVLGGKPKLGKSWLAYDMGVAVATGGKAMNAVECEQGDAIYLALEDNHRRVKDRISTLCPPMAKRRGISLKRLTIRTIAPRIDDGLLGELDKWRNASANPRL